MCLAISPCATAGTALVSMKISAKLLHAQLRHMNTPRERFDHYAPRVGPSLLEALPSQVGMPQL